MAEWPKVVITITTMDPDMITTVDVKQTPEYVWRYRPYEGWEAILAQGVPLDTLNPCVGRLAQDQQRVDRVLSEISQSLGVPIDDFRTDALAWCSTQVDTIERSLYGVLYRVQHGDPPPWVMRQ